MTSQSGPPAAEVAAPRARNLRPNHIATGARAASWLVLVRVALAARGFAATARTLGLRSVTPVERPKGPCPPLAPRAMQSLVLALRLLEILRTSCLPRALVTERVLRSRGVHGDVVIGVDTSEGFRAHAWVEVDGFPIGAGESGAATWKPLARFHR